MATLAPHWKTLRVYPTEPLALSHPLASHSQSEGRRGEVLEESQHLIGDGLTDWMTEEVDFSSYLPHPSSPPSPTGPSLPPSPLHNDIQVPSDLEVMTSLLQEELAQLEDYFLTEPLPEKATKLAKCERGPLAVGPQPLYQLPYASYSAPSQPESSPLLVTLATGELDLLSICGGPMGRSKVPRHAPYSCVRPNVSGRKRASDGMRLGDGYGDGAWSSRGNGGSLVTPLGGGGGGYSCVEEERTAGKGYCMGGGSSVEIRRCAILPKDEKTCLFGQDAGAVAKVPGAGFGFGGPLDIPHKKEELLMYGLREVGGASGKHEAMGNNKSVSEPAKSTALWKSESGEGCYLQSTTQAEAYHGFYGSVSEQVKAETLPMGHQYDLRCGMLEDQGSECLLVAREGLNMGSPGGHRPACGLKEDLTSLTYDLDVGPMEGGERKQKKRDQNKTAAHRYRQRKRAELDSLEEQLTGLEGRNRELRDKAESVEREIQYVKDLLIEVYKARSQRLKQDTSA